jgi:hypothetical protein
MQPSNYHRAAWANTAVKAFALETGLSLPTEREEAICDLITNLLHLAHQTSCDAQMVLDRAFSHYQDEILEEAF